MIVDLRPSFLRRKVIFRLFLLLYGGFVFYVSTRPIPGEVVVSPVPHFDKLVHGLEFLFFGILCFLSWPEGAEENLKVWGSIIVASAYGGFIELYQSTLPSRSMSAVDWYADLVGIFLAFTFWWIKNRETPETEK